MTINTYPVIYTYIVSPSGAVYMLDWWRGLKCVGHVALGMSENEFKVDCDAFTGFISGRYSCDTGIFIEQYDANGHCLTLEEFDCFAGSVGDGTEDRDISLWTDVPADNGFIFPVDYIGLKDAGKWVAATRRAIYKGLVKPEKFLNWNMSHCKHEEISTFVPDEEVLTAPLSIEEMFVSLNKLHQSTVMQAGEDYQELLCPLERLLKSKLSAGEINDYCYIELASNAPRYQSKAEVTSLIQEKFPGASVGRVCSFDDGEKFFVLFEINHNLVPALACIVSK